MGALGSDGKVRGAATYGGLGDEEAEDLALDSGGKPWVLGSLAVHDNQVSILAQLSPGF